MATTTASLLVACPAASAPVRALRPSSNRACCAKQLFGRKVSTFASSANSRHQASRCLRVRCAAVGQGAGSLSSKLASVGDLKSEERDALFHSLGFVEGADATKVNELASVASGLQDEYASFQCWARVAEISPDNSEMRKQAKDQIHLLAEHAEKDVQRSHWKEELFWVLKGLDTAFE